MATRYSIIIISISVLMNIQVFAKPFAAESLDVNMCLGAGSTYTSGITGIPPLSLSADYGLPVNAQPGILTAGAFIAASSSRFNYPLGHIKHSHYIFALRSTYHYEVTDILDTYGGIMLGARIIDAEISGTIIDPISSSSTKPFFALFVGAKYYFLDNMAIMTELGYGYTWLNLGVCFRLN